MLTVYNSSDAMNHSDTSSLSECCNMYLPGCGVAVFGECGLPRLRRNSDEIVTGMRLCSDTLSSKPCSAQTCRLDNMI